MNDSVNPVAISEVVLCNGVGSNPTSRNNFDGSGCVGQSWSKARGCDLPAHLFLGSSPRSAVRCTTRVNGGNWSLNGEHRKPELMTIRLGLTAWRDMQDFS